MSSTASNLLLAFLLLAANAFYVAAEFALVKSRGFRIKAMAEQNRFGARLLQGMMGNIEAYLACCQLGITMASLGLGWVGEPTVSGAARAVADPARHVGTHPALRVVHGGLSGVLLAAHRDRRAGAEDARDPPADAGLAMDRLSAASVLSGVLSAELAAQQRLTRDPAPARRQGILAARNPHRSRDRRAGGRIGRAWRHRKRRGRDISTTSSASATSQSPTSWSTAPRW